MNRIASFLAVMAALCGGLFLLPSCLAEAQTVLIEAEGFERLGGWVVDQQFMDQMGSPFLLAHGLGVPVEDASTSVEVPAAGTYRVFVRTRDWVAPWKAPGAPGRFQVRLDGRPLETTFGTQGAEWHWQDGGMVALKAGKVTVALHDLTGFEGRCDAVTHVAHGTIRVQRTGGMMGEVVGMGACLCAKHATTPRGVFQQHLEELKELLRRGVGKPAGPAGAK